MVEEKGGLKWTGPEKILPNCIIHVSKTLDRSFPNLIGILKMYMTTSVESYEVERNISKLTKSSFQLAMFDKRLNSTVSIESDIKKLLPYGEVIK